MADNYLERQRDAYEARKAAWEKKKKHAAGLKKAAARTTGDGAEMFHPFASSTEGIELPARFTYPFAYTPHPLCLLAAQEVQQYLKAQTQWHDELKRGKMFGVLVVRTRDGRLGYLAAFSGILAGQNRLPYFVPPVYDLLQPDGFFRQEEACGAFFDAVGRNMDRTSGRGRRTIRSWPWKYPGSGYMSGRTVTDCSIWTAPTGG